jgi:beta-galactosidase
MRIAPAPAPAPSTGSNGAHARAIKVVLGRWAAFTDGRGAGLRVEGRPHVELTARRWTSEDLDAASHTPELVPRDRVWVNLDHAQQGIGSASCGPGVLPQYRLEAGPATFAVVLRELPG